MPDGGRLAAADFIAEVRRAASDGYFAFNSVVENFTHCFAAPVRQADGACIATLCLVTPREDGLNNRDAYLDSLLRAAREISETGLQSLAGARLARLNLGGHWPPQSLPRPHRSPLATRHSSRMAHCWRGAAALAAGTLKRCNASIARDRVPLVNAGQSPGTSFKFRFVLCRHSDGHSLIPWQKSNARTPSGRSFIFTRLFFDPMHQPCSWPDPRPRSAARLPAETQQSNQKFPRTFNEIPPIRRSRPARGVHPDGLQHHQPARVSEEPEARNQEEKCYQEFSALKNLDPATYENTVSR